MSDFLCCKVVEMNIQILQGTEATDLRWGGRLYNTFFHLKMQSVAALAIDKVGPRLYRFCSGTTLGPTTRSGSQKK